MRVLLTLVALLSCLQFQAYAAANKIVLVETMPVQVVTNHTKAILSALKDLGYVDGVNIKLEILKAEGSKELAIKLLKESIAKQPPQLVITIATLASQAAVEVLHGTNIPIVFCSVTDPVGSGLVKDFTADKTRNITGVVFTQLHDTKVEMVMRLLRQNLMNRPIKLGIVHSNYPSGVGNLKELKKIFELSDEIELVEKEIAYEGIPQGVPSMLRNYQIAVDSIKGQVDYFWEAAGALPNVESFTDILFDSGVPIIHGHTVRSVQQGALMTVRYSAQSAGDLVVEMVDKIIKGQSPGNIPIAVPPNFNLYINQNSAKQLGLTVPSHLLMIAGDNLFQ
jgi:putative ABC transport system substrate-binding protein